MRQAFFSYPNQYEYQVLSYLAPEERFISSDSWSLAAAPGAFKQQ